MSRKARIDAPGALHHIIARGIARKKVYDDNADRDFFMYRFGSILSETGTQCFAWALIPNHFHLLLKTGATPISTVMKRLLTGYAMYYNRRHKRYGHLFQNRYKSILCQEDTYLLELVRYIHLNPLRAKLVEDMKGLDNYPYGGHSVLMGKTKIEWQDINKVLGMFSSKASMARKRYRDFVVKGIAMGRRPDLIGGGLIRSAGGWLAVKTFRKNKIHPKGDERILGDSDFVLHVLKEQNERMEYRFRLREQGYDIEKVIERVSKLFSLSRQDILNPSRQRQRVMARSVLCYWTIRRLGMSGTELSQILGMGQSSVSRAVGRGEMLVRNMKLSLLES